MGKSIGVVSLKGGVGKTSVVISLGAAIANFGKSVLLVDGNLSAPNIGMHFKIVNPEKSIQHVLNREIHAKDAIHEIGPFDILPASIFLKKEVNPLKLSDKMSYLKKKYDYIIYDSSPALNDETLGVLLASDSVFVVTTSDHPTLSVTIKAVNLAKENGTPIAGVIINKVYNKNFEIPLEDIEEVLEVPIVAAIPHDINVIKALSEFTPSIYHKPNSEASEEYKKLAAAIIGEKYYPSGIRRFFKWRINPKKHEINRTLLYSSIFKN